MVLPSLSMTGRRGRRHDDRLPRARQATPAVRHEPVGDRVSRAAGRLATCRAAEGSFPAGQRQAIGVSLPRIATAARPGIPSEVFVSARASTRFMLELRIVGESLAWRVLLVTDALGHRHGNPLRARRSRDRRTISRSCAGIAKARARSSRVIAVVARPVRGRWLGFFPLRLRLPNESLMSPRTLCRPLGILQAIHDRRRASKAYPIEVSRFAMLGFPSRSHVMKTARIILAIAVTAVVATMAPLASASAASSGLVSKRSGYVVSPAMMQAIDVIVAEKTKMMHRKR